MQYRRIHESVARRKSSATPQLWRTDTQRSSPRSAGSSASGCSADRSCASAWATPPAWFVASAAFECCTRHVRAGRDLNLEEGCQIMGLSKRGTVFGDRCTVGRYAQIAPTGILGGVPGERLRLGDNANIGPYSFIGCSGYIEIGARVLMGPRVNLLAENHNIDAADVPIKSQGVTRQPIVIEDDCWLGAGSAVLAGVTVGHDSVVAAGAVVTRDVPPYSVVGGVPARVLRTRTPRDA